MKKLLSLRNIILIAVGFSGMAALIYEIAWARMLTLVFGSTVYAFATMLSAFMAGLAVGAYLMARKVDKLKDLAQSFGLLQLGIGIYGILFIFLLDYLQYPYFLIYQLFHSHFWLFIFAQFLLYFLVLLIPTTMFGAVFPVAVKVFSKDSEVGKGAGYVYSANSLGSVIGPVLAGFILIPLIGVIKTVVLAAAINIFVGLVVMSFSDLKKDIKFFIPFIALFLILGFSQPMLPINIFGFWTSEIFKDVKEVKAAFDETAILFYKEGPYSTVTVNKFRGGIGLKSDGRGETSTFFEDMIHQTMLAYIPMMIHPDPQKVLNVGSGVGFTLGAKSNFPEVEKLHGVEIDPVILEVAPKYFSEFNNNVFEDARLEIFVTDARNYLLTTKEKYDVITSAPSHPAISGVSHLFTKEFFELTKSRLNENGLFVQWLPGWYFSKEEHKIIVNTFASVFPENTLWFVGTMIWAGDGIPTSHPLSDIDQPVNTFLVGSLKPINIDNDLIEKRLTYEKVRSDFDKLGIFSVDDFLSFLVFEQTAIEEYVALEKRQNTDKWPIVEFLVARSKMEKSFITPKILLFEQ